MTSSREVSPALRLRFAADASLLVKPDEHSVLTLQPGGRPIAVCRPPSKHEGAITLGVTDVRSSRVHMIFTEQAGKWGVADNGSTNGTYVNAVRLAPNAFTRLHAGDAISVGKGSLLRWVVADDEEQAASAPPAVAATSADDERLASASAAVAAASALVPAGAIDQQPINEQPSDSPPATILQQ